MENSNPEFKNYVESVKTKSEDLIKNQFPQKIEELNKLLASEEFSLEQLKVLYQAVNVPVPNSQAEIQSSSSSAQSLQVGGGGADEQNKKRKLDSLDSDSDSNSDDDTVATNPSSGPLTCNSIISKHIDTIKPFIRGLMEDANLLKRCVTFLIPKIEDGNNFGVSIQETTLKKLMIVEFHADSFYDDISKYYIHRADAISKMVKYPHITDLRKHVAELDEKQFLNLRIVLTDIRDHYAALYDLIVKNWEKINTPRSSNTANLY